jgi:acyl-coenzyme A thioesterase PaaI-like protein
MPTEPALETIAPQSGNLCIGCGADNPRGLKLTFALDRATRRVSGRFRFGQEYQGSGGILHGGIIALVFDEAMGKLNRLYDVRAVTAELSIAYLRPVPCEADVTVEAWETRREGRNLFPEAELRDAAGRVLARASARFVAIGPR